MSNRQTRNTNRPQQPRAREWEFHKKLIGKSVRITRMHGGSELTATLIWVDRYFLGLRDQDGHEFSMNKGGIDTVRMHITMGKRTDERRGGTASR